MQYENEHGVGANAPRASVSVQAMCCGAPHNSTLAIIVIAGRVFQPLEDVYVAFAKRRKPAAIDACPCCVDKVEICALLGTPLRELTSEQLSSYTSSVFLTAGGDPDFRYFLPRILEICLFEDPYPDREVALGKLTLANWKSWPTNLTQPIICLFEAAFDQALTVHPNRGREIDSWICGLSMAGIDVTPYLGKLTLPPAQEALREYFELNADGLAKGKLTNAFWTDQKANPQPVIAWFNSPNVQSLVWPHYGVG
jgi:hypothetical protein